MTDDQGSIEPAEAPTTGEAIARAGAVVAGAYLIARVLGYLRVVVLGTTFGAGEELDAFFAAFRIPDLIYQLVAAGAVASALVPIVAGLRATGDSERAWRIVSSVANLMLLALAAFAVVAYVTAPALVAAITPGFGEAQLARTVDLMRIMLLSPIVLALGAVATSALNGSRRFAASAAAPIVYNLAIIGGAITLGPSLGVTGLAIAVVAGSFGHLLIQLPPLVRAGFRYRPRVDLGDPEGRHAIALMVPRAIGLGITQITFVVMTSLASGLGAGAISAFTIAFSLLLVPLGVIGVPLGIVIFPSLAREVSLGRFGEYRALLTASLRMLAFAMTPIGALGIVLNRHVVELLLGYGRFDAAAVERTATVLALLLIGLPAHGALVVLARAFYARQDTRAPVITAIIGVAANTSIAIVLAGPLGLPALGIAISVGEWLETLALIALLRRREPEWAFGRVASSAASALTGSLLAAAAAWLVVVATGGLADAGRLALLVQAILATAAGLAVYIAWSVLTRSPELARLTGLAATVMRRRAAA